MKTIPPFEINVALIGYVSVGKTTFLNALLKDKYSEVSMKRCTAGINKFRVHTSKAKDTDADGEDDKSEMSWTAEDIKTADVTLDEISKSNQVLRNKDKLQEETFDIHLEEPLFEMKENTNLVLIDVPGINEAGSSKKYKEYVNNHWHTFDMVIVMLDGKQGVNTEEQVALLKLTKTNCDKIKNVPVTILMNKIDDPEDEEQLVLVKEAQREVEKIFKVKDRSQALERITEASSNGKHAFSTRNTTISPSFIPISGIHAFIYRAAKSLEFESFQKKIDKNQIDKIGKESIGRRWKRFDDKQKLEKAYEIVQDSEQVTEGLESSNFDKVLKVLSFYLGGAETQEILIEEQIKISKKRLKPDGPYVDDLTKLFNKCTLLGRPTGFIVQEFKEICKKSIDDAFKKFHEAPENIHALSKPMKDIDACLDLFSQMGILDTKKEECLVLAKDVPLRLIELLLTRDEWNTRGIWPKENSTLTSSEFLLIYGSMTGIVPGDFFDKHFGSARMLLKTRFQEHCVMPATNGSTRYRCALCGRTNTSNYCRYCHCPICHDDDFLPRVKIQDGKIKLEANEGSLLVTLQADSPEDPKHFGHVLWYYKRLVDKANSMEKKRKASDNPSATAPKKSK